MTINELVDKLIERTSNDLFQWERQKDNLYRLVLNNGSIAIEKISNSYGPDKYIVRLYDTDSCFVQYSSKDEFGSSFEDLFLAIEDSEQRAIERKINDVFGDL